MFDILLLFKLSLIECCMFENVEGDMCMRLLLFMIRVLIDKVDKLVLNVCWWKWLWDMFKYESILRGVREGMGIFVIFIFFRNKVFSEFFSFWNVVLVKVSGLLLRYSMFSW